MTRQPRKPPVFLRCPVCDTEFRSVANQRWCSVDCARATKRGVRRAPPRADSTQRPVPGAWCNACHGLRWWTERQQPKGWRCLTCHPPVHLPAEVVRRLGEGEAAPSRDADPLLRQAALEPDAP
jgi:hypothetical protein